MNIYPVQARDVKAAMKLVQRLFLTLLDIRYFYMDMWGLKSLYDTTTNARLKRQYKALFEKRLSKRGSWIGIDAEFANKPVFPHGYFGIFISGESKIGRDCVIFQHVSIGSNTLPESKGYGFPEIGDNVYIGAGAKVIGGIKIGDNVRIGANCVVVEDVEENCVVVLEKPRIVRKKHLDNRHRKKDASGKWIVVSSADEVD